MIIVEGCDGSGKDTLIERLLRDFGHELMLGPRASRSKEGPVDDVAGWLINDLSLWPMLEQCRVYNRYPVISEPIYGPLIRGYMQDGMERVLAKSKQYMEDTALVVWCRPPRDVVLENISSERDMPGVEENGKTLYKLYEQAERGWLGKKVVYDYTTRGASIHNYHAVKMAVLSHIRERNNNR